MCSDDIHQKLKPTYDNIYVVERRPVSHGWVRFLLVHMHTHCANSANCTSYIDYGNMTSLLLWQHYVQAACVGGWSDVNMGSLK